MAATSGIYKIESKSKPDRFYIGSSYNIQLRWNSHLHELRKSKHGNDKLQKHYNKYGESDLLFSIVLLCEIEHLILIEQYFIDFLNPWFNICKIAGSSIGVKRSEAYKAKVSERKKGNKYRLGTKTSEKTKDILREQKLGVKRSDEFKQICREAWVKRKNKKQNGG